MAADIIPFPDPNTRKDKATKKQESRKIEDCYFGNVDLFRLLRDTEKKIAILREKNEKDSQGNP